MLRTVIIEDEEQKRIALRQMLSGLRPDVEIIGEAGEVTTGIQLLEQSAPDLVLMDINLPDGTGFDILEKLSHIPFKIIFITAYEEHAVKAFKYSAVDYLLKPVSALELVEAIDKVVHLLQAEYSLKLNALMENQKTQANEEKRLVLKSIDKVHVIRLQDILHLEADASYCHFHLTGTMTITASKPLKEFAELFNDSHYFRVHKSHLINLKHVKRFERGDGGYVIMADDSRIPVSSQKREELIARLETL